MKSLITVCCFIVSVNTFAAPVTWTVHDAVFNNGATMTGQFDYDASTNTYSNISVQTSTYVAKDGDGYEIWNVDLNPSYDSLNVYSPTITPTIMPLYNGAVGGSYDAEFTVGFSGPLTNAGGTFALSGTELFSGYDIYQRSLISGYITAVPVPAALWLFGSALAGLGWIRRQQIV